MDRTLFFVLVMLFCSGSVYSQTDDKDKVARGRMSELSAEELAKQQTNAMSRAISLDSVQYQLVYIMNIADISAFRDSMNVVRANAEKNRSMGKRVERRPQSRERFEQRRKIAEERRQKRNESMKQILSPEQYSKYLEFEKAQQERWRKQHTKNRPPRNR